MAYEGMSTATWYLVNPNTHTVCTLEEAGITGPRHASRAAHLGLVGPFRSAADARLWLGCGVTQRERVRARWWGVWG